MNKVLKIMLFVFIIVSLAPLSLSLVIDSVSIDSEHIEPGQSTYIELGLKNNGAKNIEDVSILLDFSQIPFAPFYSGSEVGFSEIVEGKIKYAKFRIIVLNSARPDIYKIPVKVQYFEEDDDKIQIRESLISLEVVSKPVLYISSDNPLLLKGESNKVTVKIINKGLSDVKFLEVESKNTKRVDILSPKNVYVGDLDSNDFESVEFEVFFNEDSPEKVIFPIKILYKDIGNNNFEEDFNLDLRVYTRNQAVDKGLIKRSYVGQIVLIIILLILGVILYRTLKKSRRNKKREKDEF